MVSKQDLVAFLERAIETEETGLPIYAEHLANTVFLSGFKSEDLDRLIVVLQLLQRESQGHQTAFEALLKQVKGDPRDVF